VLSVWPVVRSKVYREAAHEHCHQAYLAAKLLDVVDEGMTDRSCPSTAVTGSVTHCITSVVTSFVTVVETETSIMFPTEFLHHVLTMPSTPTDYTRTTDGPGSTRVIGSGPRSSSTPEVIPVKDRYGKVFSPLMVPWWGSL
jgi:hypothetical protein